MGMRITGILLDLVLRLSLFIMELLILEDSAKLSMNSYTGTLLIPEYFPSRPYFFSGIKQ